MLGFTHVLQYGLRTADANENLVKSHMRSTLGFTHVLQYGFKTDCAEFFQMNINCVGVYPCPSAWVQDCA
eukprot:6464297-Amphidinium_carterae.1